MKSKLIGVVITLMTMALGYSTAVLAKEAPVAKLVQVEGAVEYSRNGVTWRPVMRTKYLFPGYKIKTGKDGSGKVINQGSGESQNLGNNSEIEVKVGSIALISGNLSKPKTESTSVWDALVNKFATAQRYTTVRRSANKGEVSCDPKVRTIKDLTVSPEYSDIVWRNACPEYSYRLVVDGTNHEIPAQATSEMIRYSVDGLEAGEHSFRVEVLDNDGTVYIPRKDSTLTMLGSRDEKALMKNVNKAGDDAFLRADMLETNGLHVVAMDEYRGYFDENPDDNDMRPLLIQAYQNLKLTNLRESEARLYNSSLEQDF